MSAALAVSFQRLLIFVLLAGAAGLGPVALLAPVCWRTGWSTLPLIINAGLGLVALVGLNLVYWEKTVTLAVPIAVGISVLMTAIAIWRWRLERKAWFLSWDFKWGILLLAGSLLIGWPGIRVGGKQPYRIGIDEVGYAVTGQYFREGGTRQRLAQELDRQTGQLDHQMALRANATALSLNVNIASEFVLKSQRAGYPATIAAMMTSAGIDGVASAQWLLLIFPVWLSMAVLGDFLFKDLKVSWPASLLWALALGLNVNLLNVLSEGQHAQIFSMSFTSIVFVQWWRWRERVRSADLSLVRQDKRELVFGAFIFAVIAATYSEQLIVLGAFGVLIVFIDLVTGTIWNRGNGYVVAACFLGLISTGLYALEWIPFIIRHSLNVAAGGGGFWQPQWALPVDVLGYTNIYSAPATANFRGRSAGIFWVLATLSLALLVVVALQLRRGKKQDVAFWLAGPFFVTAIFSKSFFWDHIHNYNYMKAYTLLLLPVMALHAMTITRTANGFMQTFNRSRWRFTWMPAQLLLPAWVALSGMLYIREYQAESQTLPDNVNFLFSPEVRRLMKESAIVVGGSRGLNMVMLAAYVDLPLLNLGWADPYLPAHEGKRIMFVIFKRDLQEPLRMVEKYRDSILAQNDDFLLIDTGERVQIPDSQLSKNGIRPVSALNPAKPTWPLTLLPKWEEIVDRMMR